MITKQEEIALRFKFETLWKSQKGDISLPPLGNYDNAATSFLWMVYKE